MSRGYYKRRRGIVEHVDAHVIDLLELGVHDYLNLKANLVIGNGSAYPAGVCITSAVALHSLCSRVSERTMQRTLNKLERIGWIKTWKTPGKHGNYVVLICRGSVHDLSGNEYRVNGASTMDWRHPVYELVGEVSGMCPPSVPNVATLREVRTNNTNHLEVGVELGTRQAAFEAFWERWPKKQAKSRAWTAWKKIPIAEYLPLMAGVERWLKSEQWTRGVIPHAATWLNEKRWHDEDIPSASRVNGTGPATPLDELRQKRSIMTDEGKSLLEKAGGLIQ